MVLQLAGLGTVAMPSARLLESHTEISRRCEAYARERAGDKLLSGQGGSLTELQNDVESCSNKLDTGRQLLQALILTAGIAGAWYATKKIWRKP